MPVLRTQRPDAYNYAGIRVMPCHDCSEELKASARTTTENLKGAVKEIRGRDIRPSRNRGRRTAPNVDDTLPNRYALLDKRAAHPPVSSRSVVNCLPDNLVEGSSTRALSSPVESSASPNACWPPVAFSVCPSILHGVQNTRSRSPDARRLLRRDVSPAYSPPRLDTSKIRVRLTPPMRPPVVPSESAWTNGLTRDKSSAERLVSPVHWQPGMQEPQMPEDVRELPQAPEPMVAPQLTSLEDQGVYYTRRPQAVERRIQIAMERSSPERPEAGLGSPMCQDKASDAWEVQFRQRPPSVDVRIRNAADGPGDSIGALGVPPPDLRRVSDMRTKNHLTRRPEGVERRIAKVDAENDFISGLCARHELPVEAREDCIVETPVMEEKESRSTMLAYLRRPPDVDKRIDRVECENIPEKDSALRLQDDVRAFNNSSVGLAAPHSQHQYVKSTLYPVDRFSHSFPGGAALDASRNVPDVALDHKQLMSASVLEKVFEPNNTIPSHRPVERSHKGLSTLQSAWPSTAWGVLEAEPAVKYNAMPPVKMTDAPSPPHRQSQNAYAPPEGWRATIQEKESTEHLMRPMSDAIDALSQLPRMHGDSSSSKRFGQTNAAFPKQTDTIQLDSPNMLDNLINERSFDAPPPPTTAPIATIPQPSSPCVQQASTCSFPVPCCAATPSLSSHHTECKVEDLSSDFALGRVFLWKDDRISTKRSASQPSLPLDIGVKISSSNVSDHPNYRLSNAPQPPPQHEPLTSSTAAKSVNGVLQCSTGVPPRAPELTRDGLHSPSLTVRDRVPLDASNEASDVQVHADSTVIPPVRDQEQPQRRDPHSLLRASLSGNDDGIPGTARKGDADIPRVAEEPPLCLSAEDAVGPKSVARSPPLGDQPHQSSATVANTSNTHNTLQFRRFHILELSGAEVNRDHSGSVAQYTHLDRSTVVAGSYVGTDRRTVACIIERSPQPFPDFHGDPETTFPVLRSRSAPPLLGTFPHTSSPVLPLGYVPTRNQGHPVAPERSGTCTTDVLPQSTSQQPLNFSALEKGSEHVSSPRFLLERRVLTPSSSAGDMGGLQPSSPSSILAPILPSFENLPARCSTPVREEVELTQQSNNLDSLPFVPSSPIIPPSIREGTVLMPPSSTLRSIDETSPKRGERISHKKASPDRLPDAYVESIHSRGAETNKTEIVLTNARHGEESTEHFFSDPLRDDEMNNKTSGCVDAQYAEKPTERSVAPPQWRDEMSKQIPASANARHVEEPTEHFLSPRHGGDEINKIVSASVHPRYAKEPIEWSLRPPHRGDEMNTLKQSPSDALYAKEPIERSVSPPQGSDKMSKLVFASANARRVEEPSEHSLSPRRGGDEINKIVSASVHPRYAKEPIEWSLRLPHRGDEMNTLKQSPSNALYAEELAQRSVSPPQGRDEISKQIPASANARRVEEPSEHALSTPRGGDEINNIFFASVHPRYTKEPIEWALRPSHRGDEMNTLKQSPSNALYAEELAERSVSPPQKSDDLSKLVFASANAQRVEEPTEHAFSTLRGRAESNHVYNTHAYFRLAAESTKHSVSAPPLDDEMNNALYQSVDSRYGEKPIEWSLSPALWGHERDKIRTTSAHRQRKDESVECSLSPPPLRGEFSETKTTPSGAPHCAPYTEQNISLLSKSGQMGRISTAPNRTLEAEESIERHAFAPATKGEVKTMPASFATPLQLDEFLAFRNTISSDGSDVKRVRTRWTAVESLSTRSSMEKDDFNTLFKKIDNAPVNTSGTLNSGMPTSSIATDHAPQMDLSATIHATWTEEDAMMLTAKPLRHNTCKESRKPMKDDRVDRCAVDSDDVVPLPSQGVPYPTLTCLSDFPYDNTLSSSPHVVEDASPLNETGCFFRRASDRRERVTRMTEEGINAYPGPLSLAPPLSFSPPHLASERSASRSILSELARPGFTDDSLPTFMDYSQYDARRAVNPPRLGTGGTHPVSPLPARAVQRRGEDDSTALSTTFETSDPKSGVSLTVSADKCADSVLQITEPSVFVTSGCGDVASAASSGEYDANTCEVLHEFDQPQNASVVGINHLMWSENDVHPTELVTLDADIPQDTLDDQATFLEAAIQGEREVRVRPLSPVMSNSRESSVIRSTDMADIDGALRSDDPANDSNKDISCCAPPPKQGEPANIIEDIVSPECASAQVLTTDVGAEKAMERCCDKVGDSYAQLAERSFPETVANAESDPKLPGQRELSQPPSVASEGSPLQRNILSTVSPPFPKRSVSPPALQTHAPRRSVRRVVDRRLVLHARYTSITAKQPMSSRSQSFLSNCTTPMARTPQMPFFPTRFFSQPNSQLTSQTSVVTTSGKNSTASFSAVSAVDNTRCGATKVPPVSAVAQVTTHASTCDKSLIQLASAANSTRSRIILTAPSSGSMPLHAYGRDSVASEARRTTIRGNSWVHPAKPGHNACQNITNPLPFAPVAKTANIKLQPVLHL